MFWIGLIVGILGSIVAGVILYFKTMYGLWRSS